MADGRFWAGWRRALLAALGVSAAVLAWLTLAGLADGYSYWLDELFSVTTATAAWGAQVAELVADVHPPLYQAILSTAVRLAGPSELATRGLSAAVTLAGLSVVAPLWRLLGWRIALPATLLVVSGGPLAFYAQEARSYALLLALSGWAVALFLRDDRPALFPLLAALGLTHFFGALLAVLMLGWIAVEHRRARGTLALAAATALVVGAWPVLQVALREAAVAGGSFWITSTPADALLQALGAGLPGPAQALLPSSAARLHLPSLAGIALLVAAVASGLRARLRAASPSERAVLAKVGYLAVAPALAAAAINVHTPVTTLRNFIVLTWPVALLVAAAVDGHLLSPRRRAWAAGALAVAVLLNVAKSVEEIADKRAPREDWRAAALLAAREAEGRPLYLLGTGKWARMLRFYLPDGVAATPVDPALAPSVPAGSVILFGHADATRDGGGCRIDLLDDLEAAGRTARAEFVDQGSPCRNGIALVD